MPNVIKIKEIQTMLRGISCDVTTLSPELKQASDERINAIYDATKNLIKTIYEATGLDTDGDLL